MECQIGPEVRKYSEWICTAGVQLSTKSKQKLSNIKVALSETLPGYTFNKTDNICKECVETFGNRRSQACANNNKHQGKRTKLSRRLHYISTEEYFAKFKLLKFLPNDCLCPECWTSHSKSEESDSEDSEPTKETTLEELNNVRKIIDPKSEPLQLGKRNIRGLISAGVSSIQDNLTSKFQDLGLQLTPQQTKENLKKLEKDSKDLNWIMENLKQRIQGCSGPERKSLLTLVPPSWTIKKTSAFFGISERLVKGSRKRLKEVGTVLPPIKPKKGRKLCQETKEAVKSYYYEDEVSRQCPGARDVLSIKDPVTGKREKKQKRYLQANLKELYETFKKRHPQQKLGLTSFMMQRPQEIISHNTKNFHNVCLCVHHENPKLLFDAIGIKSMKPYLEAMVCDTKKKDCHYRRCQICLNKLEDVKNMILNDSAVLQEQDIIAYRRWISTDGVKFVTEEKEKEEFLDYLGSKLEDLLKHHFISTKQSNYLRELKTTLKEDEIIIQGDFAENYTPSIQNAIQSEYFSHKQVTLHPFTVYWTSREGEEIKSHNRTYCVVSDSTSHDTNAVFTFQRELIKRLKEDFKLINRTINFIHYFSDGCAAQYKNKKNFLNLFYHLKDMGIKADWNFFATAHGKGPCDAAGGTTKRLLRSASLQGQHIITAEEVTSWAQENIKSMVYFLVTDSKIQDTVEEFNLSQRHEEIKTIAGTQQGHWITVNEESIMLFETSKDLLPLAVKKIKSTTQRLSIDDCFVNDWIGCIYEDKWFAAVIDEVEAASEEVKVTFWKSNTGKKSGTSFVSENSSCYIPIGRILKKLTPPRQSRKGRFVDISTEEQLELDRLLEDFIN